MERSFIASSLKLWKSSSMLEKVSFPTLIIIIGYQLNFLKNHNKHLYKVIESYMLQ